MTTIEITNRHTGSTRTIQVASSEAFKALNHYRNANQTARFVK